MVSPPQFEYADSVAPNLIINHLICSVVSLAQLAYITFCNKKLCLGIFGLEFSVHIISNLNFILSQSRTRIFIWYRLSSKHMSGFYWYQQKYRFAFSFINYKLIMPSLNNVAQGGPKALLSHNFFS